MKRFLLGAGLLFLVLTSGARAQTPAPSATPRGTATATPAPTPAAPRPASQTLSAAAYRARLQSALDGLNRARKQPTVNATPILKPLDGSVVVQRADGQTQKTSGDAWHQLLSNRTGSNVTALDKTQVATLKADLNARIKALDEWATPRNGAYYASFDGQKVISDAVKAGAIRVGPTPAQAWANNASAAIGRAIDNFFKWLASLLPKPKTPAPNFKAPNLSWLWFVFWTIIVALLGLLLFLAARALSGGSFSVWGLGRRRKKSAEELRDEDAELFGLAPEELRDRADAFAASGNFREALRHRFISVLVLLDARGAWRYDIRRTNWEHIAQLRRDESKRSLVAPLSRLTRAFDRVRYGGAPCDEDGWNAFQDDVREVESLVGGRAQRLEAIK